MIKWKAHYGDMWEGLPVDVMPCSNGEFLPEDPTPEQHQDHAAGRARDRAPATDARDEPTRVRANCRGLRHRPMGDQPGHRDAMGWLQGLRPQHADEQGLRPRVSERATEQRAGRVHLRRAEPPRRPERDVACDEPRDRGVLRCDLAAGRRDRLERRPLLADAIPRSEGAARSTRSRTSGASTT